MIASTIIVAIVTLSQLVVTQKTCASCASLNLRGRWQITGLPPINDNLYSSCIGTGLNNEICSSGPCFAMVFTDPDRNDNEDSGLMYIRGCQQTLMQVKTVLTSTNNETCEDDFSYPLTDSNGNIVKKRMTMLLCNTDRCNEAVSMPTNFCSLRQGAADAPAKSIIDCYECNGKDCKTGKCGKKYCMKRSLNIGDVKQVQKTCSDVNIYGNDNYCQQNDVITTPGSVVLKTQYKQCMCRDRDHCNYSNTILSITSFLFIILTKIML